MAAQQQAPPRFQSSVELNSVDVNVVDDRGQPMTDLVPGDFVVRVDGQPRRVVSAEWVSSIKSGGAQAVFAPEDYSTNETQGGGRLIVIAVDQPNLQISRTPEITTAAGAFIDAVSPTDRVAVVGFGVGAKSTPFTADRELLKQTISRLTGEMRPRMFAGSSTILPSEAMAIADGNIIVLEQVASRECMAVLRVPNLYAQCRGQIELDAGIIAVDAKRATDSAIRRLRDLITGLRGIAGPKTLILISQRFAAGDVGPSITELAGLAAASRVSLYGLQFDDEADIADSGRRVFQAVNKDPDGLEMLAQLTRGALFRVSTGAGPVFRRIESELSGYYLLGVESDPRDRDGKAHPVRVNVARRGATVRERRQMLNEVEAAAPSPRQAVAQGLNSPLLMLALPLRVATFALQGPEQGRVQLLIHADIGHDYAAPTTVSVGYAIVDAAGRTVETRSMDSRLPPVVNGVPSALQFVAGASLPPGEYTLKLAAAEGDRAGSVEHPFHARLVSAGSLLLSPLMSGGPFAAANELLAPTVGYTVNFGLLHGYLEAYGPQAEAATVTYEVAADATSPALLTGKAPGRLGGDDRMIFTLVMPVSQLPPRRYVLRAIVSAAARPVKMLTRTFEIAAPAVLMTSAEATGARAAEAELFLPVDEPALAQPFRRDEALAPEAIGAFRERVPASVKADFEAGIEFLSAGEYPRAEASLKRAIQPDVDSTAPMSYLAATFAAAGQDSQAAGAWQTALAEGADLPQVYDWLSSALLRTRSLSEARGILEEAAGKWPADPRFTRPLAMVYALFGKGREAVLTLERYLSARPDDRDAFRLGVDWIYHAHAAGRVVHGRAEDLKLAHGYADAYAKAGGPQIALVQAWLDFLDNGQR